MTALHVIAGGRDAGPSLRILAAESSKTDGREHGEGPRLRETEAPAAGNIKALERYRFRSDDGRNRGCRGRGARAGLGRPRRRLGRSAAACSNAGCGVIARDALVFVRELGTEHEVIGNASA